MIPVMIYKNNYMILMQKLLNVFNYTFYMYLYTMKRFVSILFLASYLLSLTELNQLIKLPLLIEHFTEHQQNDKSLTLYKFLYMHYSNDDHNDADNEKDEQLPFKSHNNCLNSSVLAFLPDHTYSIHNKNDIIEKINYTINNQNTLPSSYLDSIWQPPKCC